MKAYFHAFVNYEQNNWVRFLQMREFAYNNFKNINTGYTPFELNCRYHSWVFFEDKFNACSRSSLVNGLAIELWKLMNVYCQNLLHTKNLQKQTHDKGMKP